ncbi:hypothetical protein BU23DRAFT_518085 [Bimuria novae-zelandiae CBS 107.79]|uniref:DUF1275 domain protein n=1 Tax=Bimuria novae-zelandiae CBS 107.79 TaxID=1447943 RepID=A0A6A5UR66_9PLEO|nr:hypothetical protein BU23DRAFT_518085 [Bimuria novae-zelandiae CBS 107.79]
MNSTACNGQDQRADERTPLLRNSGHAKPDGVTLGTKLKKHFSANVSKNWADLVLLFCYIITGLLDSSAVFIWGSFVSMQTGNTVYFGLGVVAPSEGIRWIKALVSITSFCLGSFFFARFHRYLSPRKRWVLVSSYTLQCLLIVFAALVVTFGHDELDDKERLQWQVLVPLAAVAFQSSGQAVTSRVLQYGGLTSVVLTSNYCDLFSDQNIFAVNNVERNRRVAAPVLLLIGAMFGGLWAHSSVGLAGALWTAAGLKAAAVMGWLVWSADSDEQ